MRNSLAAVSRRTRDRSGRVRRHTVRRLALSRRAACLGARSAPENTGNQLRGSVGISTGGAPWLVQPVAAHDFQQAGVIGQAKRFSGPRDVPLVFVERAEN